MVYREIKANTPVKTLEEEVLKFWEENDIFKKSVDQRKEPFVFYEGPPTANGRPGVHHVQSRTLKDIVCRYKTMKGYRVERKGGWDTHGLPVEIEVEKELGITNKEQIEEYGIDKFNQKCRESVFKYKEEWEKITKRIGFWIDLDNPYVTLDNSYIESLWWAIKEIYNKGLLYEGYKITPYCPRCGTSLSSHEVAQGYKEVKDLALYVKLKAKDGDYYYLIWTTTPWTLISNVAIAVNGEEDYVLIEITGGKDGKETPFVGEKYVLAKKRLSIINEEYKILKEFKGKDLEYKEYERLFDYVPVDKKAFFVTVADFVTMEEGTGIVHIAPAFGEDDYNVGKKYGLPILQPVNDKGEYTEEVVDFKGRFVKDCDVDIMKKLAERNLLYKKEKYAHNYPHCWRCSTPLLYYARKSWYIKTTAVKDKMIENNKKVNWYPKEVGAGRFGKWLENIIDWGISRSRYWGTPLPIWRCEKCGEIKVVGSKEELLKDALTLPSKDDLHRPYVDEVTYKCPKCGGVMKRVPDVIDVWFDSGAMPFSQFHYPFENQEKFKSQFPADFISEGIDQTRGWFYSLMAISTLIFGEAPYKNVLVTELILDKYGQKMSKSRGNTVNPWDIINKDGADALRLYLMSVSPPWIPTRFDRDGVKDVLKVITTLLNTYSFFSMYANIDGFEYDENKKKEIEYNLFDRWILSAVYSLAEEVDNYMENYDIHKAVKAITIFIEDYLSNWYVRRNRRRFWKTEKNEDKWAAYYTLYEVLLNLSLISAPFIPFISDWIYRALEGEKIYGKESVHLCDFPKVDNKLVDKELEEKMDYVLTVVNLARAARAKTKIKIRQPLRKLYVSVSSNKVKNIIEEFKNIILDELNIKELEILDSSSNLLEPKVIPNFKVIGPKFGKLTQKVGNTLKELGTEKAYELNERGIITINVDGREIEITKDMVEFKWVAKEELVLEEDRGISIGLDIHIDEDLRLEGLSRDIVNRIQNTRKKSDLDVLDKIVVYIETESDNIKKAISKFEDYIKKETLSIDIVTDRQIDNMLEWDIDGIKVKIGVEKIEN